MYACVLILYYKLDSVANGSEVWKENESRKVQPSIYSKGLCRNLAHSLQMNLMSHPYLLVGCYLNSVFHEMEFGRDISTERNKRLKSEELTRRLAFRQVSVTPHTLTLFRDDSLTLFLGMG